MPASTLVSSYCVGEQQAHIGGHAHEAAEGNAVDEHDDPGVALAQHGRGTCAAAPRAPAPHRAPVAAAGPSCRLPSTPAFTSSTSAMMPTSETAKPDEARAALPLLTLRSSRPQQHGHGGDGQQRQCRRRGVLPAVVLRKVGEHEAIHHRADISRGRESQHQALHARRIAAARHGQRDGEAGAAHAEQYAEHQQQRYRSARSGSSSTSDGIDETARSRAARGDGRRTDWNRLPSVTRTMEALSTGHRDQEARLRRASTTVAWRCRAPAAQTSPTR